MAYKKIHRKLTADQRARGVIFSSAIVNYNNRETEAGTIHEVKSTDDDKDETIRRLKDTRFFQSMARDFHWNVEEIIRT